MLEINGKKYSTVSDAARGFRVSAKAVREWIKKGIISSPPQIDHGARTIDYFPPDYMEKAKAELERYREERKKQNRKKIDTVRAKRHSTRQGE